MANPAPKKNWEKLVHAALQRRQTTTTHDNDTGIASTVPASLKRSTNIDAILHAADELQPQNPTVARILCEQAYTMAQNLDPQSDGKGVLQFKTGLMSVIKQKLLLKGGKQIDRSRDVEILWEFYQQYKAESGVDDIQKEEQKWHGDVGYRYSEMRKVISILRALVEVMEVLSNAAAGNEVYGLASDVHSLIKAELQRIKKSDAVLSGQLMAFNIVPLDTPSVTSPTVLFPEVKAAISAIRYLDLPRLPTSFDISGQRDPDIFDLLEFVFGFQKDNIRNQREHVVLTVANAQSQLGVPIEADPKVSDRAVTDVFMKVLDNYIKWCSYLRIHGAFESVEALSNERKILLVSLYLCIWGEAANVRFLPECICYIFHHMASELSLMLNNGEVSPSKGCTGDDRTVSFLKQVICPIYDTIAAEAACNLNGKAAHSAWRNYDDFNEFFWSSSCFSLSWPLKMDSSFLMKPRKKRKTGKSIFVEHRTFLHLFRSFHRMWIFLVVMFQALSIVAFNEGKIRFSTIKQVLSVVPTYAFMNFIKSFLDVILMYGAFKTSGTFSILRIIIRFSFSCSSSIVVTYLYVRVLKDQNKTTSSGAFQLFMLIVGTYALLRVVLALLRKFPSFRRLSDKCDQSFFLFFKWIYQERHYVGRGLYEKPADYIRYVFFWLVVLGCKFAFAYYFLIVPLADSTKLIVKTRGLQYSWHSLVSEGNHNLGSIVSLWAPVVSIYLMDIHIWYTVLSALVGGVAGARARLGEIHTIPLLRKRFETFPEALFKNLVSSETKRLPIDKIHPEVSQDHQKLYAIIFSPLWNEIIKSLREEDYISNREMDLLRMPSNMSGLRFVQWPLFLLSNKILLAMDYAKDSKEAQVDLWHRICQDKYMAYAIQECYYSIELILNNLNDGEESLRIERIFREINSSILEGSVVITLSLEKLPHMLTRVTALTGLLIKGENNGAANAMRDFYEAVINEFLSEDLREQHEMSSNSDHARNGRPLFSKINPLKDEIMELVKRMHLLLTAKDFEDKPNNHSATKVPKNLSASLVPKNLEARRRLEFFTNSLFMDLPQAKPICEMMPFSVFTPYYSETVLYSLGELSKENEDGISQLFYLEKVFPDEWDNFTERIGKKDIGEKFRELFKERHIRKSKEAEEVKVAKVDEYSEDALELRFWASYRGQTLARTVRGMMYYRRAIMLQSSLERFLENDLSKIKNRLTQDYMPSQQERAQADIKFTYVVSCQIYGQQKEKNTSQAADIALLLQRNEALRVAFIHEEDTKNRGKEYYSKLVKADELGKEQEIYSVKLPGNPKLGEGKPENQNHAIIFTRGEAIQTIDMNQDSYLEEAMKMRNLLEEFRVYHGLRHPTILGVREHVFTGSVSSLAAFMSHQEGSFVTLGQRVLANPLKVRMHYGHPDVFDRIFHVTRGGISKPSRVINISEDIFAGFNSTLRQGNITHHEYIQVGKGRDVGLNQIAIFEGKVAGGNGEQVLSRDVYRLGQHYDFFRMLSFYFTTVGFYVCTMITVLTVFIFLYGRVYLALSGLDEGLSKGLLFQALSGLDEGLSKGAKLADNTALQTVLNAQFLVQIGVFTAVPMIVCFILESGLLKGLFKFSVMQLQLCAVFFTFSLLTRTHYFGRTLLHGGAKYQNTGRGFVISHIKFSDNYRTFSRSHFVKGLEVALLLIIYMVYGYREGGTNTIYILVMLSSWFPVISWLFAPFIFNPSGFEWQKTVDDFEDFIHWLWFRGGVGVAGTLSWEMWWEEEQMHIRTLRGRILETILSLRFFIFQYGIVYKLHLTGDDRRLVVYAFSWIVLLVVSMIFKLFTLNPKRAATLPLSIRLLQGVSALLLAPTFVVLIRFTDLSVTDIFASMLAFLPTGWAMLSLAIAWKPYIRRLGIWDFVKESARAYEAGMGMIIFSPVAICSWFPFVSTFQSRMLFNQAFSRGLEMSLILAGNKANAQIVI